MTGLQVGEMEGDLAGQRRPGGETGGTDGAGDVTHRLGTEIGAVGRYVDDDIAKRFGRCHLEAEPGARPADRGAAVPALEAAVDRDVVDTSRGREIPRRRHGDAFDRQHL